jgi:Putative Ig domain
MEGWIMGDIRTTALGGVPFGTSSTRPANPQIGQTYYNGTLGVQEIYTTSGWLPATGANDFNVTLNGSITTATFNKEYFAGAYTINSALLDNTYDIYVYSGDGSVVGYTKSPSLNATGNFNKIVIIGGTTGDLLSFSYKTTFTATNTTSEVTSGPVISSVTPTALVSINDSATVTGANFALNVDLKIIDSSNNEISPKSLTRISNTSITFVRPDNFAPGTYSLKVTNPGVTPPTGTNLHILSNSITSGSSPSWQTASALPVISTGVPYSTTLLATDTEGTDIDYSIISGTLPPGLSLNQETGVISGTPTQEIFSQFTIRAVDAGGNYVDRIFYIGPIMEGGTVTTFGSYRLHVFTTTGTSTLKINRSVPADYMLVAGGGAGGAAGGGAGGVLFVENISAPIGTYNVLVGAGGTGYLPRGGGSDQSTAKDGQNTSITPAISGVGVANGGQGAWGWDFQPTTTLNIWGSGAGGPQSSSGPYVGGGYTPGQGFPGGDDPNDSSQNPPYYGAGGGGAGGAGGRTTQNSNGNGGIGRNMSSYFGTTYGASGWFGGGGGGSTHTSPYTGSSGGQGGGGAGSNGSGVPGGSGAANTGGGGGGFTNTTGSTSGSGGSGIVIVRYLIGS